MRTQPVINIFVFGILAVTACGLLFLAFMSNAGSIQNGEEPGGRTIIDAVGREVNVPETVEGVICSGSGTLRLLTYLQQQDRIVGVDSIEKRGSVIDTRAYALANPQFGDYPLFGEFRGYDNPELILSLDPAPDVIFRTEDAGGDDPDVLRKKTGIPVVVVRYGDLTAEREDLNGALRTMAKVLGPEERAEDVIAFFDGLIEDLHTRTTGRTQEEHPSCYVGGIAMRGPHGFHSTEPDYPPFEFTNANNVAGGLAVRGSHATVAREKIVEWDPEVVFLDISTIRLGDAAGALYELRNDRAYRGLRAVEKVRVYNVLPHKSYNTNYGSVFANAYFVGSVLYPDRFSDIDPVEKADEIYEFLLDEPVFSELNATFNDMIFEKAPLD